MKRGDIIFYTLLTIASIGIVYSEVSLIMQLVERENNAEEFCKENGFDGTARYGEVCFNGDERYPSEVSSKKVICRDECKWIVSVPKIIEVGE